MPRIDQENTAPESTDYAARAKALLSRTLRTSALIIVPIGLAVNADASVLLPTGGSCILGSSSSCSSSTTQLPDANGLAGISLFGGGSYSAPGSGGNGNFASVHLSTAGPLTINAGGSNCAGVGDSCDLESFLFSWNIQIDGFQSGGGGFPATHVGVSSFDSVYSFRIGVDGTELFSGSAAAILSPSGGLASETLSGSASVLIPAEFQSRIASLVSGSSGGTVGLTLDIATTFTSNSGTQFANTLLVFNQADFSVTAEAPTGAPEPGTTGLTLSGLLLGVAAWFRRRRRA